MRRVVITGMGVVSALGCDPLTSFNRLKIYKNTVENLEELSNYSGLSSHLGSKIKDFQIPEHYTRKVLRTMGPASVYAVYATEQALKEAGLTGSDEITNGRTGVAYGSSFGSVDPIVDLFSMMSTNKVNSINSSTYVKMMPHTTAVNVSLYFKTTGRLIPTSTACTSSSMAIGYAYENIRSGAQDIMIAGGAEEFSPAQVAIFDALYATSTLNDTPNTTPAPFDEKRDGLVIGEGAGTLILEEYEHAKSRGAKIYAEVVGFGTNTDGTHITQANKDTMAICMKNALTCANLKASDIGYINAHGTATSWGDIAESLAIESVFGNNIPVSSSKSYIGHSLGACGALEAIWSIYMMNNSWFAPTLNLTTPDNKCGKLDYIMGEGRSFNINYVMSNNFAFGGINTSLIFKKPDKN